MGREELVEFFLNKAPVKALISIQNPQRDNFARAISTDIDATYSHTLKVLERLQDHGFVTRKKEGRKTVYNLTEDGKELAEKFTELMATLRGNSL